MPRGTLLFHGKQFGKHCYRTFHMGPCPIGLFFVRYTPNFGSLCFTGGGREETMSWIRILGLGSHMLVTCKETRAQLKELEISPGLLKERILDFQGITWS